ncbi:MAG TPA: DHH family phosphoesterase [Burkholderiales bacterium]|nr:DHH family phosphoesterase [Burkholderiales bacterium]
MGFYDIFNGDADGLCALQQLRLAEPRAATLVTGVKRDIALLGQVSPKAGDELTVLDVSLDSNRDALLRTLAVGAHVRYFDHHFAGEIPTHALLETHIDMSATTCTSLIVDGYLDGRHRMWAIVAAFGDNLPAQAYAAAAELGIGSDDAETLKDLGENLNYNAYGANLAELHFHPATLYLRMRPYADPLAFCAHAPELDTLRRAREDDLRHARALPLEKVGEHAVLVCLPQAAWSRRVIGTFANELARQHAKRIVALLVRTGAGYQVSLRAPEQGEAAMHLLARQFESGNGRARAAGIAFLPDSEVTRLRALLNKPPSPEPA